MRLVGIKATTMTSGKNEGKTGYTYAFMKEYTDYEKETSKCQGYDITHEFSYKDFGVSVGEYVTPVYEKGYQDKAVLVNLIPFKPKGEEAFVIPEK